MASRKMYICLLANALLAAIHAADPLEKLNLASFGINDLDAFMDLSDTGLKTRIALVELLEQTPYDTPLYGKTGDGRMLVLTPSAKTSHQWQITRYDRQDQPWGNTAYSTRRQCLKDFLEGVDLKSLATHSGSVLKAYADARLSQTSAVDALGKPLTLHHGTSAQFYDFLPNPRGIFLAETHAQAEPYSRIRKGVPVIKVVHLAAKRPWTMVRYSLDTPYCNQIDQSVESLRARGYDSIHCPDERVWIAFEPEQIINANPGVLDYLEEVHQPLEAITQEAPHG